MARPLKIHPVSRPRIVHRYRNRISSVRLAEEYGVCPHTILRVLREEGVRVRRRGRYRGGP